MYSALWRRIPGGIPGKVAGMLGLLVAVLAFLFFVVFPAVDPHLPWNNVDVYTPPLPAPTTSTTPSVSPSGVLPSQ